MSSKRQPDRATEARLTATAKELSELENHWKIATEPVIAKLEVLLVKLEGIELGKESSKIWVEQFALLNWQARMLGVRFRIRKSDESGLLYYAREKDNHQDAMRLREYRDGKNTLGRRYHRIPRLLLESEGG